MLYGLVGSHFKFRIGEELTLKETTSISSILANPEKFIDQKVMVEGKVLDVCKKRGCWMTIAGDKDYDRTDG